MAEAGNNSGLMTVKLVTPDRILVDATAEAVELPAMTGYLEALYGAAPLLAELGAGEVRLHGGNSGDKRYFVAWGFVEVLPESVTILAEKAVPAGDVDRTAAEAELAQADKMYAEAGDDQQKFDDANTLRRQAEEMLASADGKS
jgi:F-type H+-transporting ATPase subunit epsilon